MAKEQRNSSIEILRIAGMMGIVALHYVNGGMGGVDAYASFPHFLWFFVAVVRSLAIPLVNIFLLITGYYMISVKTFSYRKPINLLMVVFFYGLVYYFWGLAVHSYAFDLTDLLKKLFPFFFGSAWFIKTYIILYLIIPFLNKALSTLDISGYRRWIIIDISLFSVWYSIGFHSPVLDDGYGILNFVLLYSLGGYIRRFMHSCCLLNRLNRVYSICGFVICSTLTFLASVFINPFGYAFITNVLGGTFLFLAAVEVMPKHNAHINRFAKNAFDVYFTHGTVLTISKINLFIGSVFIIPHMLVTVIMCYLFGVICGWGRTILFRVTIDKMLDRVKIINKVFCV